MLDIFLYAGRAIMPLLLMMALGCGLRRVGRWSDDFYRQLNGFCFHVLLPVQLFLNVYAIEDLSVLNWRLLGFIVVCILGAAGLGVAVAPLFARDRGSACWPRCAGMWRKTASAVRMGPSPSSPRPGWATMPVSSALPPCKV